jgi:hypothetical protein
LLTIEYIIYFIVKCEFKYFIYYFYIIYLLIYIKNKLVRQFQAMCPFLRNNFFYKKFEVWLTQCFDYKYNYKIQLDYIIIYKLFNINVKNYYFNDVISSIILYK